MADLLEHVRRQGALPWLGVAWLAGPLPGATTRGVTGQPLDGLWWWHLAALVLLLVTLVGAVRAGELAVRIDRAALQAWSPGRGWRTVVVTGWLGLAVLATAQALDGRADWGHVVSFTAAAVVLGLGRRRTVGGAAVPHLAAGTVLLAVLTIAAAVVARDALDDPFAYYRLKQAVLLPVGGHNVLAGFLLAGAPAVALATVRRPRRWWPALVVVGVGLAATLSRGALVAGALALVAAWLLRDRTVARRLGLVVLLGALGTGLALATLGAANPDTGGPTSVVARSELWGAAVDAAQERPLTGVGLDGFLAFTEEAGLAAPHEHAHDLPLHAAATLGVPGLLAVAAVWFGVAAGARGQLDRARRTAVLVGLTGLGAQAMVDELALRPATVGLLALLALVVAAPREPDASG